VVIHECLPLPPLEFGRHIACAGFRSHLGPRQALGVALTLELTLAHHLRNILLRL
jgi:hypothetical protein